MLVLPGGRERSEQAYARLFDAAGLRLTNVIHTSTRMSILEAKTPGWAEAEPGATLSGDPSSLDAQRRSEGRRAGTPEEEDLRVTLVEPMQQSRRNPAAPPQETLHRRV